MKKIFTIISLGLCTGFFAQSFSVYKTNNAGIYTATLTNGGNPGNFYEITTAGNPVAVESKLTIKNNAAITQTFNVIRRVIAQSPALILDNSSNTPNTYFCFGSDCFSSGTSTPPVSDPAYTLTILSAAGSPTSSTIPKADNSRDAGQSFVLYLVEGAVQGHYTVQYTVYNVLNHNDSLAFRAIYNNTTVGIKNNTKPADVISEIYPNPAASASKIYIDLAKDDELKFQVYNSLGSMVYSGSKQKYAAGKNVLPIEDLDLNSGIYFITISNNTASTTKRLIISK